MSDAIDLFEPEGFIPDDLRPSNVTFRSRKTKRVKPCFQKHHNQANKRLASTDPEPNWPRKATKFENNVNFDPNRLSKRLGDGKIKGPSCVSMRLDDGLPKEKNWFPSLKERLEIQKSRENNVDTDDPKFIKFLKYGIRKDHNEWFLATPKTGIEIVNKKLNCSIVIPPDNCPAIKVTLPKEMNQWRLKDRLPEERKYVVYNHQLDSMIKAPFGVITAFPDDPNPLFNDNTSTISSSDSTSSFREVSADNPHIPSNTRSTGNATTQTGNEEWTDTPDTNLTAALWKTEFAIAEFEQQNRSLNIELANLKNALCSANRSRAMAKESANRAEFKLEISERVTSDLFDENKELKSQIEEATSKAESLQSELLESNKTNILLKEKLDAFDVANKRFKEILDKKDTKLKDQTEIDKLVKQLQTMRVEIDIQRAEAIQLIQAVDAKQYEKLEKCLHALLTHADHWDWQQYEKYSIFNVKRGNVKTRLSTVYYPIAYNFDKDPEWKNKCTRLPWPINSKQVPTGRNN